MNEKRASLSGIRKRLKYYIAAVLVLGLLLGYVLWSAIQMHGSVALVAGYEYFHSNSGVIIAYNPSPDDVSVDRIQRVAEREGDKFTGMPKAGPNVDRYCVYSQIITGHVSPSKKVNAFGDKVTTPAPRSTGYFIIDVRRDKIYDGLSKREWLKKLKRYGIDSELELYKP